MKPKAKAITRVVYASSLALLILVTILSVFVIKTKEIAFDTAPSVTQKTPTPFPIGVDPQKKLIVENPVVETYFTKQVASRSSIRIPVGWLQHVIARLAQFDWYQNLASPVSRILVIESGERREQVVDNFGDILRWDTTERKLFLDRVASSTPELSEGKFYPARYVVSKDATPEDVASMVIDRFETDILSRYTDAIADVVPIENALVIASLLEREAYDFDDMRHIAGVIWNRLFIGMNLQIDATLQYAKGSQPTGPWWPQVRPNDKYIESLFNTYQNEGLPPAPIANPSAEAILATLNPKDTDCIFYFHDKNGGFHCTPTYEDHVALLKKYYGRGR